MGSVDFHRTKAFLQNDDERLFIRYKAEGLPNNESIEHFCDRYGVPHNLFDKWYRDTRHKLVPVKVNGKPSSSDDGTVTESKETAPACADERATRIMIDLRMTNGIHISQRNLSYQGLVSLVEKLEGLC